MSDGIKKRHAEQTRRALDKYNIAVKQVKERSPILNTLSCGYRSPTGSCLLHGNIDLFYCCNCLDRIEQMPEVKMPPNLKIFPPTLANPIKRTRITGLTPGKLYQNSSLIRFEGKLLLAYRRGWGGAEIWLAELSDDLKVIWDKKLELPFTEYNFNGSEDPRLFIHNKQLFVEFTGYGGGRTNILYSSIKRNGDVLFTCLPYFSARKYWEKNHAFFSFEEKLFSIYSLEPHIILEVRDEYSWIVYKSNVQFPPETVGAIRGGSSPYLYNNEWYCFVHNLFLYNSERWYTIGCYTFENKPPFKPQRYVPGSLLVTNTADRPASTVPHVVFASGAIQENERWLVSHGYYDHYCEISEYSVKDIESALISI